VESGREGRNLSGKRERGKERGGGVCPEKIHKGSSDPGKGRKRPGVNGARECMATERESHRTSWFNGLIKWERFKTWKMTGMKRGRRRGRRKSGC